MSAGVVPRVYTNHVSTLPWPPLEAAAILTGCGLMLYASGLVTARWIFGLLLTAFVGCGPHDHPRQFKLQGSNSIPAGGMDLWLSDALSATDRVGAEQAANDHWNAVVGLQQVASNFTGVGVINGPRAQVYVRPGLSADGSYGPNGPHALVRSDGWVTVAAGEYATLPGLTAALSRLYFPRDPTFDAIVSDTDDQVVRTLRAQRAP